MEIDVIPIEKMIYDIRGMKVMLDSDLAFLYGVETKRLNEAVRRNLKRFPEEFMFQITNKEVTALRSQFATSNIGKGGRRYLPYAFTEHGILMLSSVLNSDKAIEINIEIMKIFVNMRRFVLEQSTKEINLEKLHSILMLHIQNTDLRFSKHSDKIKEIMGVLNSLIQEPPKKQIKKVGFETSKEDKQE